MHACAAMLPRHWSTRETTMEPCRSRRPVLMLTMSLTLLQSCQTPAPELRADYDHAADFSKFRSFRFVQYPATSMRGFPHLVTEQLTSAISNEMNLRGYHWEQSYPDLLINFSGEPLKRRRGERPTAYYDYRHYGAWRGYAISDVYTPYYDPGTVNIDLIDASRMELVWEGVGLGVIKTPAPRERSREYDAELRQAVQHIFDPFPFRAGDPQPIHSARH
jgi:hypothetical protein